MESFAMAGGVIFLVLSTTAGSPPPTPRFAAADLRGDVYRTLDALERLAQFLDMHKDIMTKDLALGAAISEGAVEAALGALRPAGPGRGGRGELDALATRLHELAAVLHQVVGTSPGGGDGEGVGWRAILAGRLWRAGKAAAPPLRPAQHVEDAEDLDDPESPDAVSSARALLVLLKLAVQGPPTELESARCIGELLQRPCLVSERCVSSETRGTATGYAATHRLLYHHVADRLRCTDAALGVGTEGRMAALCRRILLEAETIASADFPPLLRDLFAEQVALCGLRDAPGFARRAWLDEVLSWQRPAGCFGNYTELQEAAHPFRELDDNAHLDDPLGNECVSHLTGVAAAAVAFYLRVLVAGLRGGGATTPL